MMDSIIVGSIGIIFCILGFLIWKKEKISILHDYHHDNVSEENKKAFCTLSGVGVLIIGVGLLITAIILIMTGSSHSFIAFAMGFAFGMILLIFAGIKYNR